MPIYKTGKNTMNSIPCKDKLPNAIGQNGAAKAKTLEAKLKE